MAHAKNDGQMTKECEEVEVEGIVRASCAVCRKVCASFFKFDIGDARDAAAGVIQLLHRKSAKPQQCFASHRFAITWYCTRLSFPILRDKVHWLFLFPLEIPSSIGCDVQACLKLTCMTDLSYMPSWPLPTTEGSSQDRSFRDPPARLLNCYSCWVFHR